MQYKKGLNIGDMYPAILVLIVASLALGIGLYVLEEFHDSIATPITEVQLNTNTSTGSVLVSNASLTGFELVSISSVVNSSDTLTNYTFTEAGNISWGDDITAGSYFVNTTHVYIYDLTDSAQESTTTTITGLATFASWIAIIVTVIAAAIVLGIVLSSFGRRRNII